MTDLHTILRARRTSLHLTQQEVAEASGMLRTAYIRIERGRVMPTYDTLLAICKALGLDVVIKPSTQFSPENIAGILPADAHEDDV